MGRRNFTKTVRFTPEELAIIQDRAAEKGLNDSDFIRKGTLAYAGLKTNPVPEPVEKWAMGLNKNKIVEILGPDPRALERLKRFFGRVDK